MHSVDSWFKDGCIYADGVALYAGTGSNVGLKTLLSFGETRYNANKLYEAMEELQQRQVQAKKIEEEEKEVTKFYKAEQDPRLSALYQERHILHAQLSALPSKSDRFRVARKILSITDKVERILGVIDDMPQKEHSLPKNSIALLKVRNNNRSYISKPRNKANNPGEVQRRIDENLEIEKMMSNE